MTSVPLSEGRHRVANTGGVLLAGRRGLPPLASTQRLLGKRHLGRTSARIDINSPRVPGGLVVVLHLIGRHQPLAHMRAGSPGKTSISYESGPPDWGRGGSGSQRQSDQAPRRTPPGRREHRRLAVPLGGVLTREGARESRRPSLVRRGALRTFGVVA